MPAVGQPTGQENSPGQASRKPGGNNSGHASSDLSIYLHVQVEMLHLAIMANKTDTSLIVLHLGSRVIT